MESAFGKFLTDGINFQNHNNCEIVPFEKLMKMNDSDFTMICKMITGEKYTYQENHKIQYRLALIMGPKKMEQLREIESKKKGL